jgi:glycosyltransferase involved in cell wall biosynthesis
MGKVDIFHIYGGTGGSAGLYMDEIYQALNQRFNQKCFVNFYYPFNYGERIYYRLTELQGANYLKKTPKLRLVVRMFELTFALTYIFMKLLIHKPSIINYSLTGNFKVELIFLKLIRKLTATNICITLHDVVPFSTEYSNLSSDISNKQKFIDVAQYILVHNDNSIKDIFNTYSVDEGKLIKHSFPIMDARKIYTLGGKTRGANSPLKFVFVGHMRKEKGVDLLLQAWSSFNGKGSGSELTIAGNVPDFMKDLKDLSNIKDVEFISKFLTDSEYFKLIEGADFLILPYRRGTNSGIPSTALSLGTLVLCSDIPMFENNTLIPRECFFEKNSIRSLSNKISDVALNPTEFENMWYQNLDILERYRENFRTEIIGVYAKLIGKHRDF